MTSTERDNCSNIINLILGQATRHPERTALVIPEKWDDERVTREIVYTYAELVDIMRSYRAGLLGAGFQRGDRVILLFPISGHFFALVMALIANGMTAVLIDTGMGKDKILSAMDTARAKGIVTVAALLRYRFVLKPLRRIPKRFAVDPGNWFVKSVDSLRAEPTEVGDAVACPPESEALITFTSGSTGRPKGANRTHAFLLAQFKAFGESLPAFDGQVELQSFPVVALQNLGRGATTIMPAVDLAKPGSANPKVLLHQIETWKVNSTAAAPAFMQRLADHAVDRGLVLPTMRRCYTGGAPVSVDLCKALLRAFPGVEGYAVYGSTEAEPMAKARLEEVVALAGKGQGFLAGHVADAAELAVVHFDTELPKLGDDGMAPFRVEAGELGEIVVRGEHVNRGYIDNPEADRETKILEKDGSVWHRTGDVGYFDPNGLLWLTGRVKDVVRWGGRTLQPLILEAEFDVIEGVQRSAVINDRSEGRAHVFLQVQSPKVDPVLVEAAVQTCLQKRKIEPMLVHFMRQIPVDGRHNSKIDRPALRDHLDG